jgi:hypothetical protein
VIKFTQAFFRQVSFKSAEYAELIKLKEHRNAIIAVSRVQGVVAESKFLLRLKQRVSEQEDSGNKPRNILKVETATLEILNLAHLTLLKESLPATNSRYMNTIENCVKGSQASFLGSEALTFMDVVLHVYCRLAQGKPTPVCNQPDLPTLGKWSKWVGGIVKFSKIHCDILTTYTSSG